MKNYTKTNVWGSLLTVVLASSLTYAQQDKIADEDLLNLIETVSESVPAEERADVEKAVMEEEVDIIMDDLQVSTVDEAVASSVGNLISVRLNRVSLEEAINLFAQLSGANIIVPELTEAANISVNLKDVEWRPALQSILDTYNYELYQRVSGSNVFSVRRRPPGAPEPQVVETFILKYATVPSVAVLVRELLPDDAKISEFASRNMLVVKSSESSLSEIRAVLETIDIVRQQVFIESKFMELSDGTQLDLGIDWQQLGLDENDDGGLSASVGATRQSYSDGRQLSNGALFPANLGAAALPNFSEHIFTSVLDVDQFKVVLNALESDRGVNVVSNPKLIVANEEHASISIVRKEPNLKQDRQQSASEAALDTITYSLDPDMPFFEYGIRLDVTPSINTSSNITIQIKPSLTRKFDDKKAGEDNTFPIIDEKTVETVFNLASGQTAAIGGLTEIVDSIKERKVPLLGSIPFLGRLFSWKQVTSDQTETIIFVTVGLANTQDITLENSLPESSELARRRMIKDTNSKKIRESGREIYKVEEADKLEDSLKAMKQQEDERVEHRVQVLLKEREKAAKNNEGSSK